MLIQARIYTSDDLWDISHLPENTGKFFELREGELYEMSPTGWLHGDVSSELDLQIRQHVKKHRLGRVTAAETGYILYKSSEGKDTVLAPDVGFVAASRIPSELPEKYVPFAPDLAVEVTGNTDEEIALKVELYLRYGTRLVWVVYPSIKKVHVYRASVVAKEGSVRFLDENDMLEGEDVLPEFSLPVSAIFP